MNDNDTPQLTIKTVVDATGADAGAQQTVADLQKITESSGEAAEAQDKLGDAGDRAAKLLGSLRTAHHALAGIMELSEGGAAALGGLAMEGRVATEVFEGMLGPIGPLLLIVTTLAAIGIPMLERALGKTRETGKSAMDDTGVAADGLATAVEAASKRIEEAYQGEADARKQLTEAYKDETKDAGDRASALERQSKAHAEINLAIAKGNELRELGANQAGPEGEAAIERKYAALRNRMQLTSDVNEIDAQKSLKEGELSATGRRYGVVSGQRDEDQAKLDALTANRDHTAAVAKTLGIFPDQDGGFKRAHKAADEEMKKAVADAGTALMRLENFRQLHGADGGDPAVRRALEAGNAESLEEVAEAGGRQRAASNAYRAHEEYTDKDAGASALNKAIAAENEQLTSLKRDETKMLGDLDDLTEKRVKAVKDADNKETEEKQKEKKKTEKEGFDDRDARREADRERWKAELENKTLPAQTKGDLGKKILQSELAGYQDDLSSNSATLSQAEKTRLQGKIDAGDIRQKSNSANTTAEAQKLTSEQAKKTEAADEKATRQQIESATGQIEGSGNKPMIEALHQVRAAFQGKTDEAGQVAELARLFGVMAADYAGFKSQTGAAVDSARNAIDSLRHTHNN